MDNTKSLPIELGKKWIALKGMSYGIHQTTIVGAIKVSEDIPIDYSKLDETIEKLGVGSFSTPPEDASNTPKLIHRFTFWQARIQRQLNIPVFDEHYCAPLSEKRPNEFKIAVAYHHKIATTLVFNWLSTTLNAILRDSSRSADSYSNSYQNLIQKLRKFGLSGVNRYPLIRAAFNLKIPYTPIKQPLFAFGIGQNSRWLNSSCTDTNPKIGIELIQSKSATASILNSFGLPGPTHELVSDQEAALKAAERLSYPVVVKPDDLDQGIGVYPNIKTEESLKLHFSRTAEISKQILIEKHVDGHDYRIYVINQKAVHIIKRAPGGVIGDGISTISELLSIKQSTGKFKSIFEKTGKHIIDLDDEALTILDEQGLNKNSVPESEQFIPLRRKANISTGGSVEAIDIDTVHNDNINLAITVGSIFNLDIYAVDFLISDVSLSWQTTDSIICEINSMPQFTSSTAPHIFEYILEETVPNKGIIPVHILLTTSSTPTPMKEIEDLAEQYQCNSISLTNSIMIDGQWVSHSFENSFDSAQALLKYKTAKSALLVLNYEDIIKFGFPTSHITSAKLLITEKNEPPVYEKIINLLGLYTIKPEFISLKKETVSL